MICFPSPAFNGFTGMAGALGIQSLGNQPSSYEPCIVAETLVESDFDGAGNAAFRRLFHYISGQNRKRESIAMTAPVNQQKSQDKWAVSFIMPSKYTMQTLPEPLDPAVGAGGQMRSRSPTRAGTPGHTRASWTAGWS
jgi:hypothetical protein